MVAGASKAEAVRSTGGGVLPAGALRTPDARVNAAVAHYPPSPTAAIPSPTSAHADPSHAATTAVGAEARPTWVPVARAVRVLGGAVCARRTGLGLAR